MAGVGWERWAWVSREVTNGVLMAAVVFLMVIAGAGEARAGGVGGEGGVGGSVSVSGDAHAVRGGRSMDVSVSVLCPAGETWVVTGGGAVFEPLVGAEAAGGQGLLQAELTRTARCTGRVQHEKIRYTLLSSSAVDLRATYPCALSWDLTLIFQRGGETALLQIAYAPGSDSNGPEVCLDGGVGNGF